MNTIANFADIQSTTTLPFKRPFAHVVAADERADMADVERQA